MRVPSLVAIALLPVVACSGGGGNPAEDAATIDAAPAAPDAPPDNTPDAAQANCTPVRGTQVAIEPVARFDAMGDSAPLLVTSPPGDPRLFVVMQRGRIGIVEDGARVPGHFLNITTKIQGGNPEQGLLGLAFHPQYRTNRKFYVYYTANRLPDDPDYDGDGVPERFRQAVAEYMVSATDPNKADDTSGRELFSIPDPFSNHNGGMIEFGPDGKLWISVGDGGEDGDPKGNAQSDTRLLGKMLRLDVDAANAQPEIWAKGLRNPWRWSFDRMTNELYIGDVGYGEYEEINVVPASPGGLNFGWAQFEGEQARIRGSDPAGKVFPVVIHTQGPAHPDEDGEWQAIIGGQVYRGACFPDLQGTYFYTDYTLGELWSFRWQGGSAVGDGRVLANDAFVDGPSSLHADAFGELYVTDLGGGVSRIVARP